MTDYYEVFTGSLTGPGCDSKWYDIRNYHMMLVLCLLILIISILLNHHSVQAAEQPHDVESDSIGIMEKVNESIVAMVNHLCMISIMVYGPLINLWKILLYPLMRKS